MVSHLNEGLHQFALVLVLLVSWGAQRDNQYSAARWYMRMRIVVGSGTSSVQVRENMRVQTQAHTRAASAYLIH